MNILISNPINNLEQSKFLVLYIILIVIIFLIENYLIWDIGVFNKSENPKLNNLDVYQYAYSKGVEYELIKAIILSLEFKKFLKKDNSNILLAKISRSTLLPENLNNIEKLVYDFIDVEKNSNLILESKELQEKISPYCNDYKNFLIENKLIYTKEDYEKISKFFWLGISIIITLGLYKVLVSLIQKQYNIWLLLITMILSSIIYIVYFGTPRLNARGEKYIEDMRLEFLRKKAHLSKCDIFILENLQVILNSNILNEDLSNYDESDI
ncbi:MAG: hypothetical protein U0457_03135 [Candidatus Sericytochromatia bacterium]